MFSFYGEFHKRLHRVQSSIVAQYHASEYMSTISCNYFFKGILSFAWKVHEYRKYRVHVHNLLQQLRYFLKGILSFA